MIVISKKINKNLKSVQYYQTRFEHPPVSLVVGRKMCGKKFFFFFCKTTLLEDFKNNSSETDVNVLANNLSILTFLIKLDYNVFRSSAAVFFIRCLVGLESTATAHIH